LASAQARLRRWYLFSHVVGRRAPRFSSSHGFQSNNYAIACVFLVHEAQHGNLHEGNPSLADCCQQGRQMVLPARLVHIRRYVGFDILSCAGLFGLSLAATIMAPYAHDAWFFLSNLPSKKIKYM
jgi:hypothetical protein